MLNGISANINSLSDEIFEWIYSPDGTSGLPVLINREECVEWDRMTALSVQWHHLWKFENVYMCVCVCERERERERERDSLFASHKTSSFCFQSQGWTIDKKDERRTVSVLRKSWSDRKHSAENKCIECLIHFSLYTIYFWTRVTTTLCKQSESLKLTGVVVWVWYRYVYKSRSPKRKHQKHFQNEILKSLELKLNLRCVQNYLSE